MNNFKVRVINGVITPNKHDRASFKRLLTAYEENDKEVTITFNTSSNNVTDKQIKLYKAVVLSVVQITGYTYQEIEEYLFTHFLPRNIKKGISGYYGTLIPIENLTTIQFQTFMGQSVIWLNEFFNLKIKI